MSYWLILVQMTLAAPQPKEASIDAFCMIPSVEVVVSKTLFERGRCKTLRIEQGGVRLMVESFVNVPLARPAPRLLYDPFSTIHMPERKTYVRPPWSDLAGVSCVDRDEGALVSLYCRERGLHEEANKRNPLPDRVALFESK